MPSRREFLTLCTAAALTPLSACSRADMDAYEDAAERIRTALRQNPDIEAFVRFATLAANSHNTQPWRFAITDSGVSVLPDLSRRTPVVDPDDHHLFVSLGCAAENFVISAAAHGRPAWVLFNATDEGRIEIDLAEGNAQPGELYAAIPARQSTRSEYDGRSVSAGELRQLENAATIPGVSIELITDEKRREAVLDFVIQGNSRQMDDPDFVEELRDWIRFNPSEALNTADGLFTKCSGNLSLPTWIGRPLFSSFLEKNEENAKYQSQIRTSSGIAIFVGEKEDRDHWVRVGRSFQRFALQSTALGIRHSHINQPVEVPSVRSEFANWLGIGDTRPDLVVRFGYAPALPMSMRRAATAVITPA